MTPEENRQHANQILQTVSFGRIDEYQAILDHVGSISSRRQNLNTLFVGINTVFLTALGFLLASTHFKSWWVLILISAITIGITPLNRIWFFAIKRYMNILNTYYFYLEEIEKEYRETRGETIDTLNKVGIFLRFKENFGEPHYGGSSHFEMQLAVYFLALYPIITIIVGLVIFLIVNHIVFPLDLS